MDRLYILIIKSEYKLKKLIEFWGLYLKWCKKFDLEFKRETLNR